MHDHFLLFKVTTLVYADHIVVAICKVVFILILYMVVVHIVLHVQIMYNVYYICV